jgi:diguanylate cyclase (GGDEF)-like protein
MAALQIDVVQGGSTFTDPGARHAFALAVAVMAIVVIGAGLVSWMIDDRQRTESIEGLRRMALTDNLTGLPNRVAFSERLAHEIGLARERAGQLAVIGIDLNRFKEINDLRGHQAGDEVLQTLARRMAALLRGQESVARVGGDEFTALKPFEDHADLGDFLSRLESALYAPVRQGDWEFPLGASLGVAICPQDGIESSTLLNNADLAMYRAKADPLRTVCFYEPGMDEIVRERLHLAADLRHALARNQLHLHYQVQTSVSTGKPIGYEALLRWQHPEHGFIPPAEFIPLAEENGLILQIGEWVLREACAKATSWMPPYNIAVNLSAVQFAHADLPALVADVLRETGLAPERLELELTESTIYADRARSLDILLRIKALGVTIALDDFGTGYSSLDTLRSFPFDKIKLDRSFTSEVASSPQATAIIRAVLALGKSLGIPVLAEGIETADQLEMLEQEGCDEAQGFLMGRPVPLGQIIESGQLQLIREVLDEADA